jgi:hypothetical protein
VRMNSLWYGSRALAAAIGAALILGAPSMAQARTELLRWTHPDAGPIASFRVYFGTASRSYGAPVDAGKPAADSAGVRSYSLLVPASVENESLYIAVTAVGEDGQESLYSNEQVRTAADETPPPSPPPPPGDEANAAVAGFALWDASSDTLLDADFQSGEQISLAVQGSCLAIEILGNAYLQQTGSPGSLMFSFDGEVPSACSNAPITHENDPPYAWEEEEGPGQFACALTLTEIGVHTLTVTPYDGDGCTGAEGSPSALTFEVVDGAPPPEPEPEPLGQPGQPTLVP